MKNNSLAIVTAVLVTCATSCNFIRVTDKFNEQLQRRFASGNSEMVQRNDVVPEYSRLDVRFPCDITYTKGETGPVHISAPSNLMDVLTVCVEDNTLRIDSSEPTLKIAGKVEVSISAPELDYVAVSGAAKLSAPDGVSSRGDFRMDARGAADIKMASLNADNATFDFSGATDVKIGGLKTSDCVITIRGAGDVDLIDIDCRKLALSISGAGDSKVSGKADEADVRVSGAGNVDIRSLDCPVKKTNISGAGHIRK